MFEFLSDPSLWVDVSFFIFLGLVWWKGRGAIRAMLDERISSIRKELSEALNLREEAAVVLAEARQKAARTEEESQRVIDEAKEKAALIAKESEAALERQIALRELHLSHRIQHMEDEAAERLRRLTSQIALRASEYALQDIVRGRTGDIMLERAIDNIAERKQN